ncbi:MAG TPA: hypothetical protein VGL34_05355 [Steroidobacteraceae bacterium]|jgi:hypothetical protein
MAKYCLVVLSNAVDGRELEFQHWYDSQHIPDVLRVPGFTSAQRFTIAQAENPLPGRYLAIYEMETESPDVATDELKRRAGTALMPLSEAMDLASATATLFVALGDRRTSST